ncbi:hypothetical protein HA466_0014810 [Hirschfeldia incana]|nr:hypothetical protein HA466_0014810 [Hirschfeldia incana]
MAVAFTDEQTKSFTKAFTNGKDSVGFITKEKLTKMMKSTGKNPKAEVWEVLIDVDVDGNGGIYILKPFSYNEDQSTNLDK